MGLCGVVEVHCCELRGVREFWEEGDEGERRRL